MTTLIKMERTHLPWALGYKFKQNYARWTGLHIASLCNKFRGRRYLEHKLEQYHKPVSYSRCFSFYLSSTGGYYFQFPFLFHIPPQTAMALSQEPPLWRNPSYSDTYLFYKHIAAQVRQALLFFFFQINRIQSSPTPPLYPMWKWEAQGWWGKKYLQEY